MTLAVIQQPFGRLTQEVDGDSFGHGELCAKLDEQRDRRVSGQEPDNLHVAGSRPEFHVGSVPHDVSNLFNHELRGITHAVSSHHSRLSLVWFSEKTKRVTWLPKLRRDLDNSRLIDIANAVAVQSGELVHSQVRHGPLKQLLRVICRNAVRPPICRNGNPAQPHGHVAVSGVSPHFIRPRVARSNHEAVEGCASIETRSGWFNPAPTA